MRAAAPPTTHPTPPRPPSLPPSRSFYSRGDADARTELWRLETTARCELATVVDEVAWVGACVRERRFGISAVTGSVGSPSTKRKTKKKQLASPQRIARMKDALPADNSSSKKNGKKNKTMDSVPRAAVAGALIAAALLGDSPPPALVAAHGQLNYPPSSRQGLEGTIWPGSYSIGGYCEQPNPMSPPNPLNGAFPARGAVELKSKCLPGCSCFGCCPLVSFFRLCCRLRRPKQGIHFAACAADAFVLVQDRA